ncbi:oligosaccharide flippase family protein [Pseudomonas sp. MWU13-3659]|uniref:lipopolysaccharide biosynthesis protein n=1 Tax=Pseudomonas sp. MWU13-3659 TaxID=2986964 RepID=UPI002074BD6D
MIKALIPKSSFARNVLTLMTGTTFAQAVPVLVSPVLTRMYSPQEFGVFAFYLALVSILAVLATGRYELAIMVPRRDRSGAAITLLALAVSLVFCVVIFLVVLLFGRDIAKLCNMSDHYQIFYWVPVSVAFMAGYQALNYWCNRIGYYRPMAMARISQSISMSTVQVGAGPLGGGVFGLLGGGVVGHFSAFAFLLLRVRRSDGRVFRRCRAPLLRAVARRYVDFPKYLIVAHSLNMASFQAPVIVLGALFTSSVSGFFMLTQRVVGAPMSIVASAIGDVFRQQAGRMYAEHGQCREIYVGTFKRLLSIAVPAFIVFFLVAPSLFALVFGEQWRVSGDYARVLTPMFFFQFITSPLSSMYMLAQRQRLDLLWQSGLFLLTGLSFVMAFVFDSVEVGLYCYSASYSFMYAVNGVLSYRLAKGWH